MSMQISEYYLPDAQLRRLDRMRVERHFLLEVRSPSLQKSVICISGSTGNVYEVAIDSVDKTMKCSCPDFCSGAFFEEVLCKHCCFVVYRVFRLCLQENFFNNNHERKFAADEITVFERKISQLQRSRKTHDFMSPSMTQKYKDILKNEEIKEEDTDCKKRKNETDYAAFGMVLSKECSENELNDCCGMCCEELKESEDDSYLIRCGECKKLLHQECADMWLRKDADSCIYCRSWLPYSAYVKKEEQQKSKKVKRYTNSYINLLND